MIIIIIIVIIIIVIIIIIVTIIVTIVIIVTTIVIIIVIITMISSVKFDQRWPHKKSLQVPGMVKVRKENGRLSSRGEMAVGTMAATS